MLAIINFHKIITRLAFRSDFISHFKLIPESPVQSYLLFYFISAWCPAPI